MKKILSKERKELLDKLVEENTRLTDIQKEYGFNYRTIRKYYPDYRAGEQRSVLKKVAENADLVDRLAKERAPGVVIADAINVSARQLKKHRPDLFWTKQEAAEFGAMVSTLSREAGV